MDGEGLLFVLIGIAIGCFLFFGQSGANEKSEPVSQVNILIVGVQ